jgi:formate-nitrite transporter family protein
VAESRDRGHSPIDQKEKEKEKQQRREHGHDPGLDEQEKQKAEEEESLNAATTLEVIRREGVKELERHPSGLAWSGLAAGLGMGFSLVAEGVLRSHLPDASWRPLISKLGYAVGFLIVILGSQQLYTENTLMPIVPYMADRTSRMLRRVLVLWVVVLITNLIGASGFAWVAGTTEVFKPELREAFRAIGTEALAGSWGTMFLRAVFAGWVIALMVWMLPAAQSAHVWVIVIMAWLVGAASLSHIIVGTVEVMYLVATDVISFGEYLSRFMVPTLLGNTLGGVVLVALLNHFQASAGKRGGA